MKFAVFLVLTLCGASATFAAEPATRAPGPEISAASVREFVDAYWENHAKEKTPGFAVSFVSGGNVLLSKGYGFADIDLKTPVDADNTQFRIASVSKVFVGLVAAKAIADGKLDPHADINTQLKSMQVPEQGFGKLELHHLLTHSGGIDDKYFADTAREQSARETLAEHLRNRLPPRIRAAGDVMAYSNYGYALAALVLQDSLGSDFAEQVRRDILAPARMSRSGYDAIGLDGAKLATGYLAVDGAYRKQAYTWVRRYPSTSMLATTADMARLIIALTDRACSACVLTEPASALVFKQQMSHHPAMPGRTYGFAEWQRSAENGVWHDGGQAGFAAQLMIFPASRTGLFIAVNAQNSEVDAEFRDAFLEHFFPKPVQPLPATVQPGVPLALFCGSYVSTRRSVTGLEKIQGLKDGGLDVDCGDGYLRIDEREFAPFDPFAFAAKDGSGRVLAFRANGTAAPSAVFLDWGGEPRALLRKPWVEGRNGMLSIAGGGFVLMILPLLLWPLLRRLARPAAPTLRTEFYGALTSTLLLVAFFTGLLLYFPKMTPLDFRAGEAWPLRILLALPLLAAMSAIVQSAMTVRGLLRRQAALARLTLLVAPVGVAMILWLLNYWNLLGWRL